MAADENTKTELELFHDVKSLKYRDQAIWFLNVTEIGTDNKECEEVWRIHKKCAQLDKKKENGSHLDEFSSHRVLESCSRAYTHQEMRKFLVSVNPDYTKAKKVSLAELLVFNYEVDWKRAVLNKCLDWEAKNEAEEKLDEAKRTLEEATQASERATIDAKSAQGAEELASKEQDEAGKAAEESRKAEKALSEEKERSKVALEELRQEESKLKEKKQKLEDRSKDSSLGIVKRNKAVAELNMLLSQDPLPLRTAKINKEASFNKISKLAKKASKATDAAEQSMKKAEAARITAIKSKEEAILTGKIAESKIPGAQEACESMQKTLERLLTECKVGKGTIFYLERELKDAKRFLPKQKFIAANQIAEGQRKKMRLPAILA